MTSTGLRPRAAWHTHPADLAAAHAVFGCLAREVATPRRRHHHRRRGAGLAAVHRVTLRCTAARLSPVGTHRYTGPVRHRPDGGRGATWTPKGWPVWSPRS
ncbi:hypothetical protein V2I01_25705 [Micromonospora sp. BRA006-A]|nr:hypothetical protein [Micromonospora sp. BRA006-A]